MRGPFAWSRPSGTFNAAELAQKLRDRLEAKRLEALARMWKKIP